MSSEQDEGFINEMILVSANRVVGSKWLRETEIVGETETVRVEGVIWNLMLLTLSRKDLRNSSHFSGDGSIGGAGGGEITEFITLNRVLGLLLFLVMMLAKYETFAFLTACW